MQMIEIKQILLVCLGLNYAILIVWFGVFIIGHDLMYKIHSRWFKISAEKFDAIHYGGMAAYKIGILLFNLVPLIALYLI
jgi:hypothetical protein